MKQNICIFTDHPSTPSGLARIGRDLATKIATYLPDDFNVCTLGHGHRNPSLPFTQFNWNPNDYYLPFELPSIAREWAQGEPIVLMTIHDIQRMLPIADPTFCPDDNLAHWISANRANGKLKLWGYFPIDAHNKDGKLGNQLAHTLTHYDRILVPSKWAKGIVERTIEGVKVDAIPHGIDTDVFKPYPKQESREQLGLVLSSAIQWPKSELTVPEDALWIGIVATNQPRKSHAVGIQVVAEIAKTRPVFLWLHTDALKRDHGWSILELLSDFGLLGCSMVTVGNVSDAAMAIGYSALDFTLGIGRGEGFSFCGVESIFCGTPHYAGSYGAHAEYMDALHLVEPVEMQIEGPLNLLRPVFRASDWVRVIGDGKTQMMFRPDNLDWNNLWPTFSNWFKEGLSQ